MKRNVLNNPARRTLLAGLALAGLPTRMLHAATRTVLSRVRPGATGWPGEEDWSALGRAVEGRLAPVSLPKLAPGSAAKLLSNPFFLRDQPGLTQSSGWVDAWRSAPSAYVVRAKTASDVSAAVRFAAKHRLRLVVKGGGHSYFGGSNAPDSLLVWTRDMDAIALHDAFVPEGSTAPATPAVSLGAGCIWLHAYQAVTTRGGRYVQGGGCTTVGVAGLVQGGGFGSFSKTFGLAAASLLEAEIVTADGAVHVVSADREPDLFWALKGGGGGTFGVVTRLTLRTHDLPETFGVVLGSIKATSDAAFERLLVRFLDFYADHLFNPHWGEQARATRDNHLTLQMLFQGLDDATAQATWKAFEDFIAAHPADYRVDEPLRILTLPARHLWDTAFLKAHLPTVIATDDREGARPEDYWWAGNTDEAGTFWHGYGSAWMPASLLRAERRRDLASAWFAASRRWSVTFHFNKGLAGAAPETIAASRATAMNPQVLDAFALAIIAYDGPSAYADLPAPDLVQARADGENIRGAMEILRRVAPNSGSYLSECDYALSDWRQACWGEHWERLSRIKDRYDPDGLFIVHHGVGSERWSPDGFTRQA